MKKLATMMIAVLFTCAFALPTAMADGDVALHAAETEVRPSGQDVEGAVPDSMMRQSFLDLEAQGALHFEGLDAEDVADHQAGGGLMVKAKTSKISAGRILVDREFDFGEHTVGRVSVDGLCDRGFAANVEFYLDDDVEPFAQVKLEPQQGKTGWAREAARTQDVLAKGVSGKHRVSIRANVKKAADPSADKKTSVLLRSFEFAASSLPILYFDLDESLGSIDAMNGSVDHSRECYGTMRVQTPAGYVSEYAEQGAQAPGSPSEASYELEYIRGRGNSTWMADKKPYKVKLDKKADLFGMGKNKHWVLLANRYDNSLMRNKLTYWMGAELGLEYTPQCVFVEVVMNGDYLGSYYLCEQVRVGESRVDIDDLDDYPDAVDEPDITGGYLLSMDANEEDGRSFATDRGAGFYLETPSFEDATDGAREAQYNYIKNYVQGVENAIYSDDYAYEGRSFDEYLDEAAAIDYYWMQMLSMNGDAYGSGSTYLYKKRNARDAEDDAAERIGKLYWGPLWDFDYVAWGDLEYEDMSVEGFSTDAPWLDRLLLNEGFCAKFANRWTVLRGLLGEATREGGKLDQWYGQLALSRFYDTQRWGVYNEDGWLWDSGYEDEAGQSQGQNGENGTDRSYKDEENQLRTWIDERAAWVDANIGSIKPEPCTVTFKVDGKTYATVKALQNRAIGKLPADPKKRGYTFVGWSSIIGGEEVFIDEETCPVGPAVTATAQWVENSEVVMPRSLHFGAKSVMVLAGEGYMTQYELCPWDTTNQRIAWSSSDESVACVDSFGWVEALAPGTATITGTCAGGVKASYALTVVDDEDADYAEWLELSAERLTVPLDAERKIDAVQQPEPSLTRQVTWMSLDPDIASVGDAGVVFGNSLGTTYVLAHLEDSSELAVCKVTVVEAGLSVGAVSPQVYTGKKIKPDPVVRYDGKKLKKGRDYKLSYSRNKKIGTATLTVKLKGAYKGKKKVKFAIVPSAPSVKKARIVNGGKVVVTWKKAGKARRNQVSGYEVRWSDSKSMEPSGSKKVKGAAKAKLAIGKKAAAGTRYVQVRAYKTVKGKKYYSAWSKVVKARR